MAVELDDLYKDKRKRKRQEETNVIDLNGIPDLSGSIISDEDRIDPEEITKNPEENIMILKKLLADEEKKKVEQERARMERQTVTLSRVEPVDGFSKFQKALLMVLSCNLIALGLILIYLGSTY